MTIPEITNKLNALAFRHFHPFAEIQQIRAKLGGIKPRSSKPFAEFSIKEDYAFHAGGRKELQFNIGIDYVNNTTIFRYGVAFSLKQDKTLHNSKAEFKPKIEAFNSFFTSNPDFFSGYKMWYYSDHDFAEYYDTVRHIDDKIFQAENFIFIGKHFKKKVNEVSEADLEIILTSFDHLMPLYETVQFGRQKTEKRIARLCWNDNGWVMPSGEYGKSKYVGSHEAKYGFGHEEWLFDMGKTIDGYHYGFLEPIRQHQDAYLDKMYDVWLYTLDNNTKNRYWVGEIRNIEVINRVTADKIKKEYTNRNWLAEMEEQIRASGAKIKSFSKRNGVDLFNIRFRPSDLKINEPYIEIPKYHAVSKQSRYSFTVYKDEFQISIDTQEGLTFISASNFDKDEGSGAKPQTKTYIREPKAIEITYLHKAISKGLTKKLREKFGEPNVTPEHWAGYGANKIDIVVNDNGDLIFYEIKTYTSLKTSIREAIGQLLEYSLWTNQRKAKKLIIVTQPLRAIENAEVYFNHLRETYNLPLYYQSYDHEKNILSEIV